MITSSDVPSILREGSIVGYIGLIGSLCLAAWLILMGAVQLSGFKFANRDKIMGILALVAGVISLISALYVLTLSSR